MSVFPLVAEADVRDPEASAIYDEIRRELGFGMVPNVFKSMALRPTLLRTNWDSFRAVMLRGQLPRTLKEMLGILIAQSKGCEYIRQVHLHGLTAMGLSDEVLQLLVRDFERCPLPERDKTILQVGLLAAIEPRRVTEAEYERLREQDLSEEEIFEVIATAQLFAGLTAYVDSAQVPIDEL